jgi:hypothetical protein
VTTDTEAKQGVAACVGRGDDDDGARRGGGGATELGDTVDRAKVAETDPRSVASRCYTSSATSTNLCQRVTYLSAIVYGAELCYLGTMAYGAE